MFRSTRLVVVVLAVAALAVALALPTSAQTTYPGKIGVGGASWEFVDLADHSYRWAKPDGAGGWTDLTASDVDADGWLKCDGRFVYDARPVAEWAGSIDDPEVYRKDHSGVFKGSFKGQAVLNHMEGPFTISNQVYDPGTNTTTFDLTMDPPGAHHGLIVMSLTDTQRTPSDPLGSGFRDFRLIRPGYAWDTTQVFTDELVDCYNTASFAAIRYLHVNGNTEWDAEGPLFQHWSNRKLPTDASMDAIPPLNKKDRWCYEYYIDLCNQTQKDFWLCVPIAADDNYLDQLAQLVYDNLDPNLNVYLENSNEVWNYGFNQYAWNKAMAVEEVNAGTADYDYDGSTSEEVWHYRRHANRTMDIVNAFANVFGQSEVNNRLRGVLCWWAIHLDWLETYMLPYIQDNYGPPSDYFYGIGLATYMGGAAAGGHAGTENYTVDQILDDMHQTAANSIPTRQNWIAAASDWSLPGGCLAYETGTDTGGGSTTNIANRISAVRAARMYDELKYNYEDCWLALGGGLTCDLSLASGYNRYGCWGLTDDPANPDRNYQMQVIRDLLGDSATEPPNPPTNLTATGGDSQVALDWDPSAGAQTYNVKRSLISGGPYDEVATGLTETHYTDTDLTNGTTYYYVVSAVNTVGESGNSNEASATPAPDTTPPAAPTGLTATAGDGQVDLDWDDNTEPDLDSYNVYRSTTSGSGYSSIATVYGGSDYTDGSVTNGITYYYVVTAVDTSDNESGYSNEASATPTPTSGPLLEWDFYGEGGASSSTADTFHANISQTSPSGVASVGPGLDPLDYCSHGLTATQSTAMTLAEALAAEDYFTWSIAPKSGYKMTLTSLEIRPVSQNRIRTFSLFSSENGFTEGSEVATFEAQCNTGCTTQTFPITGHSNLTAEVEFRLYPYGYDNQYESVGMGNGDVMDLVVSGTTQSGDTTPPAAPTNLSATAGDAVVDLDWDDNTEPDLDHYTVYRGTGGNYYPQGDVALSQYTDTDVTNGTTYYYYVTAVDTSSNESGGSNQVEATPQGDSTPPAAPTNLTATAGDGQVDLNWDDNTEGDLASYNVYRDTTSGGPYTQIATGVATSDYTDTGVTNDTAYYYVVTAVDTSSNESGYSNEASATPTDTTPPAAPTGLTATAVSDSQIDLDWDDNAEPDLDGYNVYRDTVQIATGVASSNYSDTGLSPSTQYCYTVTAVDTSANESADSNQDCATTQAAPGAMHVDSVTVTLVPAPGPHDVPHAEVVIVDDGGAAVEGATVTGSFSGDTNQSGLSAVTDATGLAVIEGKKDKNLVSITFCVDDVTHATLTYEPGDNVETCDSN